MKIITYFLLLCLSIGVKAQTNVYHPFPETAARWNYDLVSFMGACHYQYSVEVAGDTVINSITYKRLISHGYVSLSSAGFCTQTLGAYIGAVRNDVANKKVYICTPTQSAEVLLYDFNMQVGDTLTGKLNEFLSDQNTVYAKDSVIVNGVYRNRWMVDSCYSLSIVEGIGSEFGLIEPLPGCVTDGPYYQLMCYTENNAAIYPPFAGNCSLLDAQTEIYANQIQLFPNPSNNDFSIESNNVSLAKMELYDVSGKLIRSEQLNNLHRHLIAGLKSGYYTVKFTGSDQKIYKLKLFKID